jgi:hypothetical protein
MGMAMDDGAEPLGALACEVADALSVVAPRGWTRAFLTLDRHGDQLRVAKVETELPASPPPMPQLGMDAGARMAGLAAALTDALHLLHSRGVDWSGARASVQREGLQRLVLTLHQPQGPPAASVSVPREMLEALFLAEPFLAELAEAEPAIAQREAALEERLLGCAGWKLDQAGRMVTFDLPGRAALVVEAELLGTWTGEDESWLWAWANSTVDPGCTRTVEQALSPESRPAGMAAFWRERFGCEEPFASRLAHLAVHKLAGKGMFRGRFAKGWAYLVLFG